MSAAYDIAIVGAGPAGATLARLIGRKYKVLLVDKRTLDETFVRGSIQKACGGLIAPDAQKMLAQLGLGVPQGVLVGQQLFVVRTIDMDNGLEQYYQRHYINIDREKFDRWLVSLVPSEVDTRFGVSFKSYQRLERGFRLRMLEGSREFFEEAKVIIGADGANSILRKQTFPGLPNPKTYISIQEWYEVQDPMPYFSAIFDSEITDFYSWTIPKDNFLILGAALEQGPAAHEKFDRLRDKLSRYEFKFGKRVKREGALILRPQKSVQTLTAAKGIALIGEGAGWISPSSAEGLSYAFKSAHLLAKSLETGIFGFEKRYTSLAGAIRNNILIKNLKSPFMYNNLLRKTVMLSGVQSVELTK